MLILQFKCCGVEFWTDWPECNENFGTTTNPKCGKTSKSDKYAEDDDDDDDDANDYKGKKKYNSKRSKKEKPKWYDVYDEKYLQDSGDVPMIPRSCCDPDKNQV